MVLEIMLTDFAEITKQRESLFARNKTNENVKNLNDRLELIYKEYDVLEKGLDFNIQEIKKVVNCLTDLSNLKHSNPIVTDDGDKHIHLARHYKCSGELWQAVREYQRCIDLNPNDITPYVELAQAYIDSNLWHPARILLQKIKTNFVVSPDTKQLEINFQQGVDAIFDKIKKEWMQGNMNSTS